MASSNSGIILRPLNGLDSTGKTVINDPAATHMAEAEKTLVVEMFVQGFQDCKLLTFSSECEY